MNKLNYKSTLSICIISAFAMTGCATSTLLKKDNGVRTRNVQTVLVNDTVLAFGKPSQAISALPSDSIVIAGQKIVMSSPVVVLDLSK